MACQYIRMGDGSIIFKKRGLPPTEVPGYEVDPGDPYRFTPLLPPCKARTIRLVQVPCCIDKIPLRHCTKYNLLSMTFDHCIGCNKRGESDPE